MGKIKNAYNILAEKSEVKSLFLSPTSKWECYLLHIMHLVCECVSDFPMIITPDGGCRYAAVNS